MTRSTRDADDDVKNVCVRLDKQARANLYRLRAATGIEVSSLVRILLAIAEPTHFAPVRLGTAAVGHGTGDDNRG